MQYDVFISYSRQNMELADRVEKTLKSRGLRCFIDRESIEIGEDFAEKIGKSIYHSEVLLLIWTPESNQSDNVAREVNLAQVYSKIIIPFQIGDFIPHYRMAYMLALANRADKRQGFSDVELDKLADKIIKSIHNSKKKHSSSDNQDKNVVENNQSSQRQGPAFFEQKMGSEVDEPVTVSPIQHSLLQRRRSNENRFESEYLLGCEKFRKYNIDEAFDLLLEPALADYKDARRCLYYCISTVIRCRKISRYRFEDLMSREDLVDHGFALYVIGVFAMYVRNDNAMTYSYAVRSMEAGSDYGTMLYVMCHEFGYGVEKNFERVFPRLRRLALNGNVLAQFRYGRMLIYGWNGTKDVELGSRLIKGGADSGDINCLEQLADLYLWGISMDSDPKVAEDIYNRLVSMGWVEAYDMLGMMFCYDKDGKVKDATSFKTGYSYFMKGAELGDPGCMQSLAFIYQAGFNGKPNINVAIRWFNRAAQAGLRNAYFNLGYIYYYGEGEIPQDTNKAWEYFKVGAEKHNSWDSYYMMALMYHDGNAPKEITKYDVINYYQEVVFGGSRFAGEAASYLYDIYHEGKIVPKDELKGIEYLRQAAEYGQECALLKIGKILAEDINSPYADEIKGIKYLTQAYEAGNVESAIILAELYRNGVATVRDLEKSKEYLQFAINKEENPKALCEMGKLFSHVRHHDWDEDFEDEQISQEQKILDQDIAIDYLTRAAEKKYAEAFACLCSIGIDRMYDDDNNLNEEIAGKVLKWAEGGVELDYPQSILDLAIFYNYGIGTDVDLIKAEKLYLKATEAGHKVAPSSLANLYAESFPAKMSDAYYYALLSEERGYNSSRIKELDKSCADNARKLEAKGDFDVVAFADYALPRKIRFSQDSDYTMSDFDLIGTEHVNCLIKAYKDATDYVHDRNLKPAISFSIPYPTGDYPVIKYIDQVRWFVAALWKGLRNECQELQTVSFHNHSQILDIAENAKDAILQQAIICLVELYLELEDLYSIINSHK